MSTTTARDHRGPRPGQGVRARPAPWTGSPSTSRPASCSAFSGPTAPARRPPSASWPPCSGRRRARPGWPARCRAPSRTRCAAPGPGDADAHPGRLLHRARDARAGRAAAPDAGAPRSPAHRRAARADGPDLGGEEADRHLLRRHARRLDLASALVHRPELLILDEPTEGLDPQSRTALWEELERISAEGTTMLLTTHYMEEADRLCTRLAIIDNGQIVVEGTPAELKRGIGADTVVLQLERRRRRRRQVARGAAAAATAWCAAEARRGPPRPASAWPCRTPARPSRRCCAGWTATACASPACR